MSSIKDTIQVNTQGALLGLEESGFSFVNQFHALPQWKRILILVLVIGIIPGYLLARFGTEQYLARQYGRQALTAQAAFAVAQNPVIGDMQIIRNPNGSYSAAVLVTNPNIDLSANGITYSAKFLSSNKQTIATSSGTLFLLANEKKYLVFPRIENANTAVSSGTIKLDNLSWQKRLNVPEITLRASEPILYDESNPLNFIAEGSIINESPYQISAARIVFLLFDENNKIIGVSQRDESRLLPFGRRAYKQQWPGLYRSQVRKVQVIATTNTLDDGNITTSVQNTAPANTNTENESPF